MKKYIQIISLFLAGYIILPGCTDSDFIDRQPLDQKIRATFFSTETEIQQSLAATYRRYRSQMIGGMGNGNGSSVDMEAMTDNGYTGSGYNNFMNFVQGNNTASSNNGFSNNMWNHCWEGIAACNFLLDNIERNEVKNLVSDVNYKKYKGEAIFNRCYYYFLLTEHFGDIPWINFSVTPEMPYLDYKREAKSKIVTELLKDIDVAIDGLPLPAAGYTDGHAIKSSAIMLKVRILMANKMFQEAITAAELLIKNSANPHKIVDDFEGIFYGQQDKNAEIIFSVQYSGSTDLHSYDFFTATRQSGFPIGDLAIAYGKKANGDPDPRLRYTMYVVGDKWTMNTLKNADGTPRPGMEGTYTYPEVPGTGISLGTFDYVQPNYPPRKLYKDAQGNLQTTTVNADGNVMGWSLGWKKGVNPAGTDLRNSTSLQHRVMMRYADLLLLYAEAKVEIGGGATTDADALAAFNAVRTRASVDMPAETELTRGMVHLERRLELAYEGVRFYDLLRWDIGKIVCVTQVNAQGWVTGGKCTSASLTTVAANAQVEGSNGTTCTRCVWPGNLWPIPQTDMDIMKDAGWKQNPPY